MRASRLFTFAAASLIVTSFPAPSAYAGFVSAAFGGASNRASISGEATERRAGPALRLPSFGLDVAETVTDWLQRFHSDDLASSAASETDATASGGCERAPAASEPQQGDAAADEDNGDKNAEPTGPEPIYFGF